MKLQKYFTLVLVLLLTGCNSEQGDNDIKNQLIKIELREDLSIPIDSLNTLISGSIEGIAVDTAGNIHFQDREQAKIHILDPAGGYIDSVGQRGHGPGEFQTISGIFIYNNILYVLETYPNRLSEFSLDNYQLLRTVSFPDIRLDNQSIGNPYAIFPLTEGQYLVAFRHRFGIPEPRITISIVNQNLESVDTVIQQFMPGRVFHYIDPGNFWFFNSLSVSTLIAIGPNGNVYQTYADSMHINVFNSEGHLIRDISAEYVPPLLTNNDLDSLANGMSPSRRDAFYKALNQNELNSHWPAIQNLLVDDQGRSWVELVTPGNDLHTWWVFDADDKPKWQFELSRHVQLYVVRNHEVYGIWRTDGEYPRIVRYNVEGI